MADETTKLDFEFNFSDAQSKIKDIVGDLDTFKNVLKELGVSGSTSFKDIASAVKTVFRDVADSMSEIRKVVKAEGVGKEAFTDIISNARLVDNQLKEIYESTAKGFSDSERNKTSALEKAKNAQIKAIKETEKLGKEAVSGIKAEEKSLTDALLQENIERKQAVIDRIKATMEAEKAQKEATKAASEEIKEAAEKQSAAWTALGTVVLASLGKALKDLIQDSTMLAAKNEVLATSLAVVGANMGHSTAELSRTETAIRALGISIEDTRNLMIRFSQANLGMENATRLARAAQDLAVGTMYGSSDALQIMTNAVSGLLPRQLRQFGIVVDLNSIYRTHGLTIGKTAESMSELEKRQGLLNRIFEEAEKRSGAYETSMQDAGKVLGSLTSRIIPDTISMFGEKFLPVFKAVIFTFKDLLEWVQNLGGGWKTLIAGLAAGLATFTLIKAGASALAFTVVGLTKGLTAGISAIGLVSNLNPWIAGLGILATAIVLLTNVLKSNKDIIEENLNTSLTLLNVRETEAKAIESLIKSVNELGNSEKDIQNFLAENIDKNKELIPLLGKEGVTREEIIEILNKELVVRENTAKVAKEAAESNAKVAIKSLNDEQFVLGEMIKLREKLAQIPEGERVLASIKGLRELKDGLSAAQQDLKKYDEYSNAVYFNNADKLAQAYKNISSKLNDTTKSLADGLGSTSKKSQESISQMNTNFEELLNSLDKIQTRTTKKFIFLDILRQQEEFNDQMNSQALKEEDRRTLSLKSQAIFQDAFVAAEIKFVEKLNSIGKTKLEQIEANKQKELEINEGSELAIQAIEYEAAYESNRVYADMWDKRLKVTSDSTNNIISVIEAQKDRYIATIMYQAEQEITINKSTEAEIIEIKEEAYKKSFDALLMSQAEEKSIREEYYRGLASEIEYLYETGTINIEEYTERSKALALEENNFRSDLLKRQIDTLKTAYDEMLSKQESAIKEGVKLVQQGIEATRKFDEALEQVGRKQLPPSEQYAEDIKSVERAAKDAIGSISDKQYESAKQSADFMLEQAEKISQGTIDGSVKIEDAQRKAKEIIIKARGISQDAFQAEQEDASQAAWDAERAAAGLGSQMDELASKQRDIDIEIKGGALVEIEGIRDALVTLPDSKTITVDIVTTGAIPAIQGTVTSPTPTEGETSTEPGGGWVDMGGFAKGAVNIKGAGTGTSDSMLAKVSKGESIITSFATNLFKPLLELMNQTPEEANNLLIDRGVLGAGNNAINNNNSNSATFGDIKVNVSGVKNAENINWKEITRQFIMPEMRRVTQRKSSI